MSHHLSVRASNVFFFTFSHWMDKIILAKKQEGRRIRIFLRGLVRAMDIFITYNLHIIFQGEGFSPLNGAIAGAISMIVRFVRILSARTSFAILS